MSRFRDLGVTGPGERSDIWLSCLEKSDTGYLVPLGVTTLWLLFVVVVVVFVVVVVVLGLVTTLYLVWTRFPKTPRRPLWLESSRKDPWSVSGVYGLTLLVGTVKSELGMTSGSWLLPTDCVP